jgi:tetratricopeptide (TPR) repeat protein
VTTNKIIVTYEGSVYAEAKATKSGSTVIINSRASYGGHGVSFIQVVLVSSVFLVSIGFAKAWAIPSSEMDQASPTKKATNTAKDSSSMKAVVEPGRELAPKTAIVKLKSEIRTLINDLERDFPESNEPKVLLGKMYRQLGDYAKAVEIWKEILRDNPRNVDVLSNLGMVALEMEEYEKAVMYWRRALVINPRMPGLHQDTGFALLEAGQYREAIKELQEELKLSPQSCMALNLLGQCYLQLKEYRKARETYQKVIEIDPKNATAYYGLITVHTRLKQPDKVKEYTAHFKRLRQDGMHLIRGGYSQQYDLTQMRSGVVTLILDASALYRSHGNVKKADSLLERAMKLAPEKVISYMKGQVISHQMRLEHPQALALIEKVAELEPDNADNYLAIGILSLNVSRLDKAEAAFKRTIELAPKLPDGYRELARLYTMLDIKPREALKLAKRAVELEGSAEDYYILSCAYINNNQKSEALSAMQKALELEPENPFYRRVYDFLKKKTAK